VRKNFLLPGLIALFSIVNSASQQKPLVKILEEDDLRDNSLNKKSVIVHFETEKDNYFQVKIAGKELDKSFVTHESTEERTATYAITGLQKFLVDGNNSLEVIVGNTGKKSSAIVDINIGSATEIIDGFEFELCKRAFDDYKNGKKYHKQIAGKLKELNKLVPKEYQVTTVLIPYVAICECEDKIEKGGTGNAWAREGKIGIGYGNIKNDRLLRNAIYHEFGHIVYNSFNRWGFIKTKVDFEWTHFQITLKPKLFELFQDSNYSFEENAGHPQDNASELFASAFMIRTNYFEEYKQSTKKLSRDDKELTDDVMRAVESCLQTK